MNFCRVTGNTSLVLTLIKNAEEVDGKDEVGLDTLCVSHPPTVCEEISDYATFIIAVLSGIGN